MIQQPTEVTLFQHPILTLRILTSIIIEKIRDIISISLRYWYVIIFIVIFTYLTYLIQQLFIVREFGYFCLYWILLGVASSIGLGTGLHTFVLYLGPHIAKVAIMATQCGYVPQMIPSRWSFNHFQQCSKKQVNAIGFITILLAVQIQSFLWGFGTALGQLPPYFIAKHAAQVADKLKQLAKQEESNKLILSVDQSIKQLELQVEEAQQQLQQLQQIEKLQQKKSQELTLLDKAKLLIYSKLQKYAFITVLLCASIPNPLFDLAGITCGHFKVPFKTFFSATFIGKAIIKVHIQMLFVIAIFRKQSVEYLIAKINQWIPSLEHKLTDMLDKQKKLLYSPQSFEDSKPIIARIWDIVLIVMISYFVISIINTSVQHRLIEDKIKKQLDIKGKQ